MAFPPFRTRRCGCRARGRMALDTKHRHPGNVPPAGVAKNRARCGESRAGRLPGQPAARRRRHEAGNARRPHLGPGDPEQGVRGRAGPRVAHSRSPSTAPRCPRTRWSWVSSWRDSTGRASSSSTRRPPRDDVCRTSSPPRGRATYTVRRLRQRGIAALFKVHEVDPGESILKHSRPPELRLITTRALEGLKRWLLGRLPEKVFHEARLPVLSFRGPGQAKAAPPSGRSRLGGRSRGQGRVGDGRGTAQ